MKRIVCCCMKTRSHSFPNSVAVKLTFMLFKICPPKPGYRKWNSNFPVEGVRKGTTTALKRSSIFSSNSGSRPNDDSR